ncbi:hypothetical protein GCM10025866_22490 [Naasia aerilata]|uniref:Signal recognition particle SRP54 helical bundle domain-containing protein n=1 Tax=Naasia aerilata TaxID=1162966 RepID=A0ABN6XRR8_9MICO|nr:hypothetical protein GCM10025866_22490 [Naasia aerilata]
MADRTPWSLAGRLRGMFGGAKRTIDEDTWEDLEAALIGADFGPTVTDETIADLREKVDRYRTTDPGTCSGCCGRPSRSACPSSTPRSASPSAPPSCSLWA